MTTHDLKTWPEYHAQLRARTKTFEIRVNDRDYRVGDTLRLREWDPETREYTNVEEVIAEVTYILPIPHVRMELFQGSVVVMALRFAEGDRLIFRKTLFPGEAVEFPDEDTSRCFHGPCVIEIKRIKKP